MAVILILIIIQHWIILPAWLFWGIIGFWIIKDVVLFPVVWRAYDWERPGRSRSMVGEYGVARDRLAPSGYVQVRGELWRAEKLGDGPPIEAGQPVAFPGDARRWMKLAAELAQAIRRLDERYAIGAQ